MAEGNAERQLAVAADKLTREAARLRRDVRALLAFFADPEPDGPEPTEVAFERTADFTMRDIRSAARVIRECDVSIAFIHNMLANGGLSNTWKRGG